MSGEVLTFTGVNKARTIKGACTNGTTPSLYALQIVPQTAGTVPITGTLVYGNAGVTITWTDCLIDRQQTVRNRRGFVCVLFIWDRRWLWQKTVITGRYNVRRADGTIDSATEKTPQQLATLLLTAMGEGATSVTMLPNDDRPEVDWAESRACDALEDLLDDRGCVIGIPNNVTTIFAQGTGSGAPANDDVDDLQTTLDPPEVPQYLRAVCAATVVQSKLLLAPLAMEADGELVELDDASYKPAGGWTDVQDWEAFPEITDEADNAAARLSVGRLYRVTSQADGSQDVPGLEVTVSDVSKLFPLSEKLLETYNDLDGKQQARRAYIEATWLDEQNVQKQEVNTPACTLVTQSWDLGGATGIVKFNDVFRYLDDDNRFDAVRDAYLTCTYSVPSATNNQYSYAFLDRDLGGLGIEAVPCPNLFLWYRTSYTDCNTVYEVDDNATALTTALNAVLDAAETRYTVDEGWIVGYRHIQSVFPNGVIRQVGWIGGIGTFKTFVGVGIESVPWACGWLTRWQTRQARTAARLWGESILHRARRRRSRHWRSD